MTKPTGRPRGRPARNREAIPQSAIVGAGPAAAEAPPIVDRPEPRPEMRAEPRSVSSRERAALRAAQIKGHIGDLDEGTDEFWIDPAEIPDGWSYEWKRVTVLGAEDPSYQTFLARRGWEPVDARRHPDMMPRGSVSPIIERKGMVLMERPMEITQEVKNIEKQRARNQVRAKEEQLSSVPDGQFDRRNKDASLVKVGRSYAPVADAIPVPQE